MLASGEHTLTGLERELGITPGLLREWKREAKRDGDYVTTGSELITAAAATARIRELEKENALLQPPGRQLSRPGRRSARSAVTAANQGHRQRPGAAWTVD